MIRPKPIEGCTQFPLGSGPHIQLKVRMGVNERRQNCADIIIIRAGQHDAKLVQVTHFALNRQVTLVAGDIYNVTVQICAR